MKAIALLVFFISLQNSSRAEFALPPEITNGLIQSSIGESNGLYIHGADKEAFTHYLTSNWKLIVDHIEILRPKNRSNSTTELNINSVANFVAACEQLPPLEYIDLLEKMLDLFEQKRIDSDVIDILLGQDKKHDFLSVNWEHPRVRSILTRMTKLVPSTDETLLSWIREIASGKLADNYMYERSDDDPRPETLPGIKLVRPWDSLIKKYERLTGKKLEESHDPTFNPRPDKTGRIDPKSTAVAASPASHSVTRWWPWLIGSPLSILAIVYSIRRYRKHRSA